MFTGTDPDRDAESFVQLIERKINFAPGDAPASAEQLSDYNFRKKALFSLHRGAACEWYGSNTEAATSWNDLKRFFYQIFRWTK